MSRRSWSACHSATGSPPASRTARAASTSSSDPGKVSTPIRTMTLFPVASVGGEVQFDVLDDGVGQQRLGDLLQLGLVGGAVDVEHEVLALADAADTVVTEAPQRAQYRLPLRVGDLRLEDHVDDHPGHAPRVPGRARPA